MITHVAGNPSMQHEEGAPTPVLDGAAKALVAACDSEQSQVGRGLEAAGSLAQAPEEEVLARGRGIVQHEVCRRGIRTRIVIDDGLASSAPYAPSRRLFPM